MPLSKTALASRALVRIGASPINSFEDDTAEAEIATILFDSAQDALLSSYPWSFATGQIALPQLEDSPLADYQYAFQLPLDFLRALSAGNGGRGKGLEFRIHRNTLHANVPDVILTYIFRPNEGELPPFFEQALITRLSAEFCIPLTENTSRSETLYKLATQEFINAKRIDAQQDTPARIDDFSLINARG